MKIKNQLTFPRALPLLALLVVLLVSAVLAAPVARVRAQGGVDIGDAVGFKSVTIAQFLKFRSAASQVIPGNTSFSIRNNANTADNLLISDAGNVTVGNNLATIGTDTVGTFHILTKANAITVTDGAAFTPTGSFQPIAAAGNVTPTLTILPAGTSLCVLNTSNVTITFAAAGIQKFVSSQALAQYNTLCALSDGTNWYKR